MSWFVIRTKPRQEQRASEHLENQSFEFYCPWMTRDNGKREPLFPGYLFVLDSASEQPFAKIRSTRGVLGFVRFGLEFAKATDELIETIKARELDFQNVERFKPNDKVVLKDGPFSGLEAVFKCKSGSDRSIILLKMLNQTKEVKVDLDSLKLA